MNKYRIGPAKRGAVDSKYFSNPDGLDRDVEQKKREHEECKQKVRDIILSDPAKMDLRVRDVLDTVLEIKNRYGI